MEQNTSDIAALNTDLTAMTLTQNDLLRSIGGHVGAISNIVRYGKVMKFYLITTSDASLYIPDRSYTDICYVRDIYIPKSDVHTTVFNGSLTPVGQAILKTNGLLQIYQSSGAACRCNLEMTYITV